MAPTDIVDARTTLRIPVAEERVSVTPDQRVTGRVTVRTVTETTEQQVEQALASSNVDVKRIPVNRWVEPGSARPGIRVEGDVTIIPVLEKHVVVETRLLIKEEVHVTRSETSEIASIPVTLRAQKVLISREDVQVEIRTPPINAKD